MEDSERDGNTRPPDLPLESKSESEVAQSLSRVRLFATPWTVAYQVPPSMGFSRQEYIYIYIMKRQRNTTQKKERTRNTEVQINEEEIRKLPEKEFRIMIVKMIQNLKNKLEKLKESITHLTRT